jgi:polar amino acid transport system substrate-binding protein
MPFLVPNVLNPLTRGLVILLLLGGMPLVAPSLAFGAELTEIQERGYLIVAVKDNLRPLGFRNAEGELEGLEIDIARQLAEDLLGDRNAVVLYPTNNLDRLSLVLSGEVDLAIADVTATASRARIVSFSAPYYVDGTAFVTRDPEIQTLADAFSHSITVLNGSSSISTVRSLFPDARFVGVDSYQQALESLESQQANTFVGDASVLAGWVQDYPDYRMLPNLLSAEPLCIAMPKGNQYDDLRRQINQTLETWTTNGWLQERIDYWGLPQ